MNTIASCYINKCVENAAICCLALFFCGYCMMLQCTVYTALNFADNVWLFKVKKNLNKWTLFVMHCPKNILEQMQRNTVGICTVLSYTWFLSHYTLYSSYVNKSSCICSSRDRSCSFYAEIQIHFGTVW